MILFVTVLHIFLCVLLILVILLQPGKGGDVASAFGAGGGGGGGGSNVFGPRGPGSLLSKATTGVAVLFMVTSITLALNSQDKSRGGADELDDAVTIEEVEGFGLPAFETKSPETPSIILPGQENAAGGMGAGTQAPAPEPEPEIPDEIRNR
ncbi:MAG: preprotein translocase subunit SecG [Proteobacteria bacterium]|nr:preprotein translocase subunit SecG [Pseudomonadota bacterium]MCP4918216.1 preprotein translocase subunit SecG [Pseudomonadota bacterium]